MEEAVMPVMKYTAEYRILFFELKDHHKYIFKGNKDRHYTDNKNDGIKAVIFIITLEASANPDNK
jgi:hypothetical protein